MSQRLHVVSALHGHHISLGFTAGAEARWYAQADQDDDPEDTIPFDDRVNHRVVSYLLSQAAMLDPKELDRPYMPEAHTTLLEAAKHLGNQGRLGIQGGMLSWNEGQQTFSVCARGRPETVVINRLEVMDLLRANYPRE